MYSLLRLVVVGTVLVSCAQVDGGTQGHGEAVDDDEPSGDDENPAQGPDFEVRYQTKYVDIAPGFTQPVCRGTLDEIDRYMEVVADKLDIDLEGRTTVYWYNEKAEGAFTDNSERCDWCSPCAAGCYYDGVAHVSQLSLHHELVHAVVTPPWGRTDTLFSEGIADGSDRQIGASAAGISSIYNLPSNEKPSDIAGSGKHGGARFSPWLVDQFGPASFRELFERLSASPSKEEVFAVVEDVYGLPFEELEAEYFANAPTAYPLPALCDGHVHIPWNGDRWELSGPADCDAPYMFGPNDDGGMTAVAIIEISPEYVDVPMAMWIPSDVNAKVWPCIDEPLYDPDETLLGGQLISNWVEFPVFRMPGRYRVELPVYEAEEVYLRLCPDNGKSPWDYPADKSVDPENCPGD